MYYYDPFSSSAAPTQPANQNTLRAFGVDWWTEKKRRKDFSALFFISSQEKRTILDSYRKKAKVVVSMLRSLEGVVCNEINGSLYAFPSIKLPRKAVEAAKVRRFESSALHIDQKFSSFCAKDV